MQIWFAVLSLLVASGCKSKSQDASPPPPPPQVPSTTYDPTDWKQQRAAHLKSIEIDLTTAEAARKATPLAPPADACGNAKISLVVLSQEGRATIDPLSARYDAACSAIAVDKLDLPPDLLAPAKAVQDALRDIEATYRASNYAVSEAGCMKLVDHMAKLEPSKLVEMKQLWGKGDRLCHLLVPVATLDAAVKTGSDCRKERVQNAYALLARGERLESPSVSPLIKKWNEACPQSALASN
ncbi:MAG: hypothetical protein H0T42_15750 [Deltaproteobacteria bacterium]|nr:hypothetical protein [Deltaproteobacteria bacterium]